MFLTYFCPYFEVCCVFLSCRGRSLSESWACQKPGNRPRFGGKWEALEATRAILGATLRIPGHSQSSSWNCTHDISHAGNQFSEKLGTFKQGKLIGACTMTTKFLDNKIFTFKILLSWRFPRKIAFWTIFLPAPLPTPPWKAQILFLLSSRFLWT